MELYAFSVYDSKAQAYIPPFFLPKKAMAIRSFSDCVNSASHQFGQNPADYTLFCLGLFDDDTGLITADAPKSLGNGLEFLKQVEELDSATAPALKLISKE